MSRGLGDVYKRQVLTRTRIPTEAITSMIRIITGRNVQTVTVLSKTRDRTLSVIGESRRLLPKLPKEARSALAASAVTKKLQVFRKLPVGTLAATPEIIPEATTVEIPETRRQEITAILLFGSL